MFSLEYNRCKTKSCVVFCFNLQRTGQTTPSCHSAGYPSWNDWSVHCVSPHPAPPLRTTPTTHQLTAQCVLESPDRRQPRATGRCQEWRHCVLCTGLAGGHTEKLSGNVMARRKQWNQETSCMSSKYKLLLVHHLSPVSADRNWIKLAFTARNSGLGHFLGN